MAPKASNSVSYGKATPYLPVIDFLKAYFGIEARDDTRKRREKVTGKLLTLERALEPTLPAFLTLLEVPVEDQQWHALDPQQRRQRTDALKRLLLHESQVQPLCVVFEDLHWIDAETQHFWTVCSTACPPPVSSCWSITALSTSTAGVQRPTTPSSGSTRCPPPALTSSSSHSWGTTSVSNRSNGC